ncbi:NADP-dependent fatty aldehyde dehydrogenase [Pannonibacter phragmitetus]|uniref:NADP-dependent fatty aldehyde dehydrogenase n=1 Tax=Pannonibacter phragmitetus TaxID=121719 RepID=A0A378ZY77_9HYPH|nr:aldehyde dehydrogenase (NADP(+)) [Pannonibacter phragmitetus]SUB02182.1 NADP-dependent fatty aldehyde dehydrogenase [Pannonibacter phragmitetus]
MLTGKHLIAGAWVAGSEVFSSSPVTGEPRQFAAGGPAEVDAVVKAAEAAFAAYAATSREERAVFLERIATEIEARGAEITEVAAAETALPTARLEGERGRTTGQLRLFAAEIRKGAYLDVRKDAALPDRAPLPRPEIRLIQRPIGPVAVFGASNFPLAFSTAGGDTASALAAGCPVVVKGHPAHPGTGELVAQAIDAAIKACGMPAGVFSLIQGPSRELGEALVRHPLIKAVGFTGSLGGGRALFDLCASRPEPIPFFGELGSVNPLFVLPAAHAARGEAIAKGWAASLTMGVGQFCTNPGLVLVMDGAGADAFIATAEAALKDVAPQTMLTDGIASAFAAGAEKIAATGAAKARLTGSCPARQATPHLFETSGAQLLANPALTHEVFGPLGIVVRVKDKAELARIAESFEGQLTVTLQMDDGDVELAASLMPVLERKAGRILANGFPTGVEVCDAMVHGGPYPASTNFGATSVGTMAIRRWVRPVSYQNLPEALLPADLR